MMRRKLSGRETALLILLLIVVLASGYYLGFYMPAQDRRFSLEEQIQEAQGQIEIDQVQLAQKERMEAELEEIFAQNPNPVSIAAYDNSHNVMFELHTILLDADQYSLNFSTVDTGAEDHVARRRISLEFGCGSYESARQILQRLHDSSYRCMFDDLSIRTDQGEGRNLFELGLWWSGDSAQGTDPAGGQAVEVSVTLVFFEYLEQQPS